MVSETVPIDISFIRKISWSSLVIKCILISAGSLLLFLSQIYRTLIAISFFSSETCHPFLLCIRVVAQFVTVSRCPLFLLSQNTDRRNRKYPFSSVFFHVYPASLAISFSLLLLPRVEERLNLMGVFE